MIKDAHEEINGCPLCNFLEKARKSETVQHLKNARRELLLAAKSAIENCLNKMEQPECDNDRQARKVEID